ncbi:MAG: sulfur carrier protein ThiS [Ruminococcus sp.]|nr:sulfur carrier protein ThiS [Ruminococcus sp.]
MIRINGEDTAADGMKLTEWLSSQGLDEKRVAVMINGSIVSKDSYESTVFQDGDEADIIGFVGGG